MWRNKLAHSYGVREVAGAGPAIPTMKKISAQKQKFALSLRRKGLSHRDIAHRLHISLGSVFIYTKSVHLTPQQSHRLQLRTYKKGLASLSEEQRKVASTKGGKNGHKNYHTPYSKEILLSMIREFVKLNGRIPTKRELGIYRQILLYFGTWNKAIKEAGFSTNPVLFANKYIANDGHKCDSLSEKIIDDWLSARNILHERHVRYFDTKYTADFKVNDIYIEFFGLHGQLRSYDKLMKKKLDILRVNKMKFISIYPTDIFPKSKLDSILGNLI